MSKPIALELCEARFLAISTSVLDGEHATMERTRKTHVKQALGCCLSQLLSEFGLRKTVIG